MSVIEEVAPVKQTVLYINRGEYNEEFRFVLKTDGTGTMYDIDFDDYTAVEHDIDLETYAREGALVLTDPWDASPEGSAQRDARKMPDARNAEERGKLADVIQDLFEQYNYELQNPVGDPPDDTPLYIKHGTEEDMLKCIAAISYLASLHGYADPTIDFYTMTEENEDYDLSYANVDLALQEIVLEVVYGFHPVGATYEYVDQNDGRVTSHAASGHYFQIGIDEVEQYFPSARERLECRTWLHDKFVEMKMDVAFIDKNFPGTEA